MFSVRIAEGRTLRIVASNGEELTLRRDRGSMFVVDSPRSIIVKLIPQTITKKEEPDGNRKH